MARYKVKCELCGGDAKSPHTTPDGDVVCSKCYSASTAGLIHDGIFKSQDKKYRVLKKHSPRSAELARPVFITRDVLQKLIRTSVYATSNLQKRNGEGTYFWGEICEISGSLKGLASPNYYLVTKALTYYRRQKALLHRVHDRPEFRKLLEATGTIDQLVVDLKKNLGKHDPGIYFFRIEKKGKLQSQWIFYGAVRQKHHSDSIGSYHSHCAAINDYQEHASKEDIEGIRVATQNLKKEILEIIPVIQMDALSDFLFKLGDDCFSKGNIKKDALKKLGEDFAEDVINKLLQGKYRFDDWFEFRNVNGITREVVVIEKI